MRTWVFAILPPIEVLADMALWQWDEKQGLARHAGGLPHPVGSCAFLGLQTVVPHHLQLRRASAPPMLQTFSPARSIAAGSLFDVDVSSCSQVPYLRVSARLPVKLWCIQKRQQVDWTRSPASEILPIAEGPRVILAACATGYSSVQRQAAHALR